MMWNIVKGTLVGAIIAFIWCNISWMALPWHTMTIKQFKSEQAVARVLDLNTTGQGVYVLPSMDSPNHFENPRFPFAFIAYTPGSAKGSMLSKIFFGFVVMAVVAFFITYLFTFLEVRSFAARAWVATLLAVIIGVVSGLPDWNWWDFSTPFALIAVLDSFITWLLAGIGIAWTIGDKS